MFSLLHSQLYVQFNVCLFNLNAVLSHGLEDHDCCLNRQVIRGEQNVFGYQCKILCQLVPK